jgi:hypothetical protein
MAKTKCERFVCVSIHDFITENWDKINLKHMNMENDPKDKFLKEILTNFETAMWCLTEVMGWGMDKHYFKTMVVYEYEDDNSYVFLLNGKYIKCVMNDDYTHTVTFVEPKTKTVIYFD